MRLYFRNRGVPTNRALASACSPAPTTQLFSIRAGRSGRGRARPGLARQRRRGRAANLGISRSQPKGCRVAGFCQAGAPDPPGGTPQTPLRTDPKKHDDLNGREFGVLLCCLTARGQKRGWVTSGLVYGEALPSLTVLTRRSAGASVGASSAHANGQRRSRQLSAWMVW